MHDEALVENRAREPEEEESSGQTGAESEAPNVGRRGVIVGHLPRRFSYCGPFHFTAFPLSDPLRWPTVTPEPGEGKRQEKIPGPS